MLLNILAGFTYNILTSGLIFFFFIKINTFVIYYCFLGFGVWDSFYISTSFVFGWLHKGWIRFTLIENIFVDYIFPFYNFIHYDLNSRCYFTYCSSWNNSDQPSPQLPHNTSSDYENESNSETAEELAKRYPDDPKGLNNHRKEKEDEISLRFLEKANKVKNPDNPTSTESKVDLLH